MLLVEREIGGIERVLFAVKKQIVELDHVQRQKPGRLTYALYGPALNLGVPPDDGFGADTR